MLQVECESCQAPYKIDEWRIPAAGLKMRCARCGHSFSVKKPNAAATADTMPPPPKRAPEPIDLPAPSSNKYPSDFPASLVPAEPDLPAVVPAAQKRPIAKPAVPRASNAASPGPAPAPPQSPAARSAFGELDLDLPAVAADLPSVRPNKPTKPAAISPVEIDLPIIAADLPSAKAADLPSAKKAPPPPPSRGVDLPVLSARGSTDLPAAVPRGSGSKNQFADLPSVATADLPVVAAELPVVSAGLPAPVAPGLPIVSAELPSVPSAAKPSLPRSFGEIDLPTVGEISLGESHAKPAAEPSVAANPFGDFGELELPEQWPAGGRSGAQRRASAPPPSKGKSMPPPAVPPSSPIAELEFAMKPDSIRKGQNGTHEAGLSGGEGSVATSFGELDLETPGVVSNEGNEAAIPTMETSAAPQMAAAAGQPAPYRAVPVRGTESHPVSVRRPRSKRVLWFVAAGLVLAGASLQLTQHGAFGYLTIVDLVRSGDYAKATNDAMSRAQKTAETDTYDSAKAAVDTVIASRGKAQRAQALTAYAMFSEYALSARFGSDPARSPHAKQWMSELPPNTDVKYLPAALAAEHAYKHDWEKARKSLDAVSKRDTGDPIQREIAVLRGEVELRARDPKAAQAAFQRAVELGAIAAGHSGLAASFADLEDLAATEREVDATLKASPGHIGARLTRARLGLQSERHQDAAFADLAYVLEGEGKTKASPAQSAEAFGIRGWLSMNRAGTLQARQSFEEALKLDGQNFLALEGQGELLFREGRFTEALTRFDTALNAAPDSPIAVFHDAKAKLELERLQDAKTQVLGALEKHPKNVPLLMLLGRVELSLGNLPTAEEQLRKAVASSGEAPLHDAVSAYTALAVFLASKDQAAQARGILDEARKKLPESPELHRAIGEFAEREGKYEEAMGHYRSAIALSAKDPSAHFRLGIVQRRLRHFDEAGKEFDRVHEIDPEYPGLALERGALFEQSGDIEKALVLFQTALAKAPDDPDLQLRIGSAYVAIGRPTDAIPMLKKVLEKRPTSAEAHHYIGRAYMLDGRGGEADALRFLKRAVELDPNRAEYHLYLGWAANDATPAQLALAKDEIDKAVALDKLLAEAYWQRGVLERKAGAVEDAMKDLRHALELRPTRYEAHAALAEVYEDKNEPGAALGEWGKAVAANPNKPLWRYRLGRLQLERGDTGNGFQNLAAASTLAEKLEPPPAWVSQLEFFAGEAARKTGQKNEAIKHYKRFLEIAPTSSADRGSAQKALEGLGVRD